MKNLIWIAFLSFTAIAQAAHADHCAVLATKAAIIAATPKESAINAFTLIPKLAVLERADLDTLIYEVTINAHANGSEGIYLKPSATAIYQVKASGTTSSCEIVAVRLLKK